MASGKAHARGSSRVLVLIIAIIIVVLFPPHVTAFVAGLVIGHYATPDVRDQHRQINEGERMVREHFGVMAFRIWVAIWWMPARLIPHRHWASHLPGVATLLAAAWIYWLPLALMWLYVPGVYDVLLFLLPYHIAGWSLQDAVHLWQDGGLRKVRS